MTNSTLIDQFYAGIRAGDADQLSACIHPDFVLEWQGSSAIPWAGVWEGAQGLIDFFATLGEHVDVVDVAVQHTLEGDDATVVILRGKWRVGPARTDIEATAANVFTFRDEKIAGYSVVNDTEAFAKALAIN